MMKTTLSPEIRLMQLAFAGVTDVANHSPDLADLARCHGPALATIRRLGQAHDHVAATSSHAVAEHFDRLAATDPDLAVAAYSFGDTALLADFTAEVVEVAKDWTDTSGDILDFGCGAGRVSTALAPVARSVTGVDISGTMIDLARARVPDARFVQVHGGPLPFEGTSFDLVLAVDSFPFLVQTDAIEAQLAEIARVLRPGGRLLVFNWTYGDPAEVPAQIAASPLTLLRGPERPFRRWDATAFLLGQR